MDWEQALRARLKDADAVDDLVWHGTDGRPAIDWDVRPQATGLSAVTLQTIDEPTGQNFEDVDGMQRVLVQVDAWARDAKERALLKRAIKAALLSTHTGNGFRWSRAEVSGADSTERVETATIYRSRMDFTLHYAPAE